MHGTSSAPSMMRTGKTARGRHERAHCSLTHSDIPGFGGGGGAGKCSADI